jgi:hypothetical protein
MKQIRIIGKTNQEITMLDNDNEHIELYTKKISGLLESKNVIILHTSSASIVVRPNDIFSIEISNIEVPEDPKKPFEAEKSEEQKKEELQEDIITDLEPGKV